MNKTKLQYHLIFVTKYRKKILFNDILDFIKKIIYETSEKHHFEIIEFGSENGDHIHLIISLKPLQSITKIVQLLKQYTRYYAWKEYGIELRRHYWYNNYLWSSGYFCSTIGNVSKEIILEYVKKQSNSSTDDKYR